MVYRIYFKIRYNRHENNVYYFVMMTAKTEITKIQYLFIFGVAHTECIL